LPAARAHGSSTVTGHCRGMLPGYNFCGIRTLAVSLPEVPRAYGYPRFNWSIIVQGVRTAAGACLGEIHNGSVKSATNYRRRSRTSRSPYGRNGAGRAGSGRIERMTARSTRYAGVISPADSMLPRGRAASGARRAQASARHSVSGKRNPTISAGCHDLGFSEHKRIRTPG